MQNNIVWVNVSLVRRLVWMVDIIAMQAKENRTHKGKILDI